MFTALKHGDSYEDSVSLSQDDGMEDSNRQRMPEQPPKMYQMALGEPSRGEWSLAIDIGHT